MSNSNLSDPLPNLKLDQLNSYAKSNLLKLTEEYNSWTSKIKLFEKKRPFVKSCIDARAAVQYSTKIWTDPITIRNSSANTNLSDKIKVCSKCYKSVYLIDMHIHSVLHLNERKEIEYYFKCLRCKGLKKFTCMHLNDLKRHLLARHSKNRRRFVAGFDFMDRREEYRPLVLAEIKECFKYNPIMISRLNHYLTTKSSSVSHLAYCVKKCTGAQTFRMCDITPSNNRNSMIKPYLLVPVKTEITSNIKHLFTCLLCLKIEEATESTRNDVICRHIKRIHRVSEPKCNVHYTVNSLTCGNT